ncbi:MAG: hypothetical protein DMG64_06875 [Acidobacteria bacterium]|nr:MAG: hypothetical protein DMG64_06875 [Acidobacteriota bacterium]PYY21697.1 MAG: hypothetical protein DMG62_17385 [Acidobacteriota bacterium]
MTDNNKVANSRRADSGTGRLFATCAAGRNRSTRRDNQELKVSRPERQSTNQEPKLPKGYRHIRSAIEAVLECSGEHVSA